MSSEKREFLEGEVLQQAKNELVSFPRTVGSDIDEALVNQGLGLVSFMIFDEPKTLNGDKVLGFVKLRGNYPGNEQDDSFASRAAEKIIREQDSKHQIRICSVGKWVPITNGQRCIEKKVDVEEFEGQQQLRSRAIEEKNAKDKAMIKQLKEKEEQLKAPSTYDDKESLDYYTLQRNTELYLFDVIGTYETKLVEFRQKLGKVRGDLFNIETNHPDYKVDWLENYNIQRRKSGIPDYVPSESNLADLEVSRKEFGL